MVARVDTTARKIFELGMARSRSFAELPQIRPLSRPAVSLHLKVLSEASLARTGLRDAGRSITSTRLASA